VPAGETQKDPSGWTVDTLQVFVQRQLDDMRATLQERYETQTKAVDAAFLAQQTAMQTALTAAERAVATAMLAAEKAVDKAESAAEKRFEAVNEFRGQLNDIVTTLISRAEAETRITALSEKLDAESERTQTRITELDSSLLVRLREMQSRLDLTQGQSTGMDKLWGYLVGAVLAVGAAITVVLALTR